MHATEIGKICLNAKLSVEFHNAAYYSDTAELTRILRLPVIIGHISDKGELIQITQDVRRVVGDRCSIPESWQNELVYDYIIPI